MNELTLSPTTTVHDYAEWFRQEHSEETLAANYAADLKKMETIAQTTPGIQQEALFKVVLSVVEQIDDPLIFGLGVCWLDQKGYSDIPMSEVLRLRGGSPPVE